MHLPYQIHHIDLHRSGEMPVLNSGEQGNYLVFWWKTIPLGDLYLEPGHRLSEPEYYNKLAKAVLPAINQYARSAGELKANVRAVAEPKNFRNMETWLPDNLQKAAATDTLKEVPVSVIICTRNRAASLKQCLDMFQKMTCQPREIIIIDNARENDETEIVARLYPNVKYYQEPEPGLSYARNTA